MAPFRRESFAGDAPSGGGKSERGSGRQARARGALAFTALLVLAACESGVPSGRVELLETLPHDTSAYTQGLVFEDGALYESTGRYGSSELRRLDPRTGEVLEAVPLPEDYFGEGLASVDGRLVQLTWREGVALVYDRESLAVRDTVEVSTNGWGLCYDGRALYMTTGSSILFRRDPETLERTGEVQIVRGGRSLREVNELECVGDHVYGNVFRSETLVRIEKATGRVVTEFDASRLVPRALRGSSDAVLNGIAYDEGTGTFYLTGKLWPVMYRVRLVPE